MDVSGDAMLDLGAAGLAAAVRGGRADPVGIVDSALARIERVNPALNAFCTVDAAGARAAAADLARRRRAGEPLGPLAGVPIAVKDLLFTAGMRMCAGSPAYRDFVPDTDDVAVARARAADAVIIGKTNVPELGYSGTSDNPLFGPTANPWDTALEAGGSSAGSAAAVAAGCVPVGIGSDAAGSIRLPAAFCGVVGLKPTMGRVPLHPGCRDPRLPGLSSFESLEHVGPMSRSVEDAALLLSVIGGPDPRDRLALPDWDPASVLGLDPSVKGLRVGFTRDFGYAEVDPAVLAFFDAAVRSFEEDLGCRVEEVRPEWPDPGPHLWALVAGVTDLEGMRRLVDEHADAMSPHIVEMVRTDWRLSDFTTACRVRQEVTRDMNRLTERYDLLLSPAAAVLPFAVGLAAPPDGPQDWTPFALPMNLTGQPAASVPCGWTPQGLPVGLQIAGRRFEDATVLRACAAYEAAHPWISKYREIRVPQAGPPAGDGA